MNCDNETCIQRVIIYFYYANSRGLGRKENKTVPELILGRDILPASIREWKSYLEKRLERIAQMIEILLAIHDDWAVTGRKGYIQMETQSLDFKLIISTLTEQGFQSDEYLIDLDYTRKWGVL